MAPADASKTQCAILEAAQKLFLDKGVAGASISQIAAAAGVTKSLIYHHFETKDDLWAAVKDHLMQEYTDLQAMMLRSSGDKPDLRLLETSLRAYFRFLQRRPEFVALVTMECMEVFRASGGTRPEKTLATKTNQGVDLFRTGVDVIAVGQTLGHIRNDVSPELVLLMGLGQLEHWIRGRWWLLDKVGRSEPVGSDVDDWFLEDFLRVFIDGLRPAHAKTEPTPDTEAGE